MEESQFNKIAEVVEASTTQFIAHCYELDGVPDFGGFVHVGDHSLDIFAVVSEAQTVPLDSGRRPVARGRDISDEHELMERHPEIRELLRTEFTATVVGFRREGYFRHYLPPRPSRIHGFVYPCTMAEVMAFTECLDFIQTLISSPSHIALDELVAASIRNANAARGGDREFLIKAGKEVASLLSNDPTRLNGILRRIVR